MMTGKAKRLLNVLVILDLGIAVTLRQFLQNN